MPRTIPTALFSLILGAVALGCAPAANSDPDVESTEQGLVELAPILGHLDGTTPQPDFHAEELQPAQFPFAWSGAEFPKSKAVATTLGSPVTLPAGLPYRAAVYSFAPGADLEICAQSATAKAKLWLYTTKSRGSSYCNGYTCNDPDELDETARAANAGDSVCTRGSIPKDAWGPHYVVVDLGPGSAAATATVTTRAIKISRAPTVDAGPFSPTSCQGPKLTLADVQARVASRSAPPPGVGTFDTAARTRACNRFRGCTPWQPVDTAALVLHGSCSGCIPGAWTNASKHGSIHVAWDDVSFGPYAKVLLYPDGTTPSGAAVSTNHVSCDLSLTYLPSCQAAGDWTNWLTLGGTKLGFADARENAFTKTCVRTVARPIVPSLYSEYDTAEVVFHGAVTP